MVTIKHNLFIVITTLHIFSLAFNEINLVIIITLHRFFSNARYSRKHGTKSIWKASIMDKFEK